MKTRNILRLLSACSLLILAAACDVKDPIFNTSHPGHGMVTLTTDWSAIGTGLTAPESYTVSATPDGSATSSATAAYTATLTGVTNRLDHLFAPDTYRFCVYNTPEHITISGTTATVAQATVSPTDALTPADVLTPADAAPADAPVPMISNAPGWLFTSVLDNIAINQDAEHTLTAQMQQQVRELTLIIKPKGDAKDRIERIEAYLTGAATKLDFATGTYSDPQAVPLPFTKITAGAHAGSWSATVRLLGTAGSEQQLKAKVHFADGNSSPHTVNSDLTSALITFNTDKRTPLTLGGTVDTPPEAEAGGTITDWATVTGDGPVVAE